MKGPQLVLKNGISVLAIGRQSDKEIGLVVTDDSNLKVRFVMTNDEAALLGKLLASL